MFLAKHKKAFSPSRLDPHQNIVYNINKKNFLNAKAKNKRENLEQV